MFGTPGFVFTCYITKLFLGRHHQDALLTYIRNHQQTDGGWGLHLESPSTMFGTVMNYVAMRLLGLDADNAACRAARAFIHAHGGAIYAPSWCKFWLALLGLYEWEGIASIPVEMWLLPRWFPFHPGKMWCHSRMVYLPMGYLFCRRFQANADDDPLLRTLREELYPAPYDDIDWQFARGACSPLDAVYPLSPLLKLLQACFAYYERRPWGWLRRRGLDFAMAYIHEEDRQTDYINIGSVSKMFNMLCVFADSGADCPAFQRHMERLADYLWVAEDGMKVQGYNGSQCWDTSLLVQAVGEGGMIVDFASAMLAAGRFLDQAQIRANASDIPSTWFRHPSMGGWPFSTAAHGWPTADCTAEALKAVLALMDHPSIAGGLCMPPSRLFAAIDMILGLQNVDGGWSTYEPTRGYGWYEHLNPSEVSQRSTYPKTTPACGLGAEST